MACRLCWLCRQRCGASRGCKTPVLVTNAMVLVMSAVVLVMSALPLPLPSSLCRWSPSATLTLAFLTRLHGADKAPAA